MLYESLLSKMLMFCAFVQQMKSGFRLESSEKHDTLEVMESDTICNVKAKIEDKVHLPISRRGPEGAKQMFVKRKKTVSRCSF